MLEDLYRYPRKHRRLALAFWALTGLVGGHRFYLDRPLSGLLMAVSGGGVLVWWVVDAFLIRTMVEEFNTDQAEREHSGLPPSALAFMPPVKGATLPPAPPWAAARGRRGLIGDLIVLVVAGLSVGAFAANTGTFEPIVAILALSAITLLGARWEALAHVPMLRSFDRWSHRLRLYYYINDPGGPLTLFFRPMLGLVTAPFRRRARAEAWLYLQLGFWFTIVFTGADLVQAVDVSQQGLALHPTGFFVDMAMTFASIYAFAAPIGAILTTHVLLEKRDQVVWLLTGVTLTAVLLGLGVIG